MAPRCFLRRTGIAVLGALLLVLLPSVQAQEDLRKSTSLGWIPADAAFYASLLRNREQLEALTASNAFQKAKASPLAAMGLAMLRAQWENPEDEQVRRLKEWYQQPESQELVKFLLDALSHEVFIYGDASFTEMMELGVRLNRRVADAQREAIQADRPVEESMREFQQSVMEIILENSGAIQIPDLVIGFKIEDANRARLQIARLEELVREQLKEQPNLGERLTHQQIAGNDFLTWRLDGSLVPWEELTRENEQKQEIDPETLQKLIDAFRKKELAVSVGVRESYLLISVGDDSQHLEQLGRGPLLIDRRELAPLRKFADKPLTSVAYGSEALRRLAAEANRQRIEGAFANFQMLLSDAAFFTGNEIELDEATRRELAEDLRKLSETISGALPQQGAGLGFAYRTPQGYEGYAYDWSENPWLDATKPLTVLNHVGGSPLAYYAARRRYMPENYDAFVRGVKRTYYYVEKIGLPQLGADERAAYDEFWRQAKPLLDRLDRANRELLIPAFRDSQGAVVLDAKTTSAAWHRLMPPSQEALPLLELAVVYGVSDAEAVKQGAREYLAVAREIWDKAKAATEAAREKAINEGRPAPELPDFDIVYPSQRQFDEGVVYYYALPQAWGLDPQLAPNAALSPKVLVFSYTPKFSLRLLQETPLEGPSLPADPKQPLGAAGYLNFAGVIDAVEPWIHYAIDVQAQQQADPAAPPNAQPPAQTQAIKTQVQFALDLLRCYRGFSSITYRDADATVTRYQSHYQDLPQ